MPNDANDKPSTAARAATAAAAAAGVAGAQGFLFGEDAEAGDPSRRPSAIDLDAGEDLAPVDEAFDPSAVEADLDRLLDDDPLLGTAVLDTGDADQEHDDLEDFAPDPLDEEAFDQDPVEDDPAHAEGPDDVDDLFG